MVKVTLTKMEVIISAFTGCMRRIESLFSNFHKNQNLHMPVDNDSEGWNSDIEGACGETAVAKALNVYYGHPVNNFKLPDVGKYQVRHTTRLNGKLIVRTNDDDNEKFYLVVGMAPNMQVIGWLMGIDAKKQKYLYENGKPCWMVPQRDLVPIGDPIPLEWFETDPPGEWWKEDIW